MTVTVDSTLSDSCRPARTESSRYLTATTNIACDSVLDAVVRSTVVGWSTSLNDRHRSAGLVSILLHAHRLTAAN